MNPMTLLARPQFWRRVFYLLALLTLLLSLLPVAQLPQAFNFWDKAQHALGFAALMWAACQGWARTQRGRLAAWLLAFGALIELLQHASGWRQGDLLDWLADAMGVGVGWAASAAWQAFRRRY